MFVRFLGLVWFKIGAEVTFGLQTKILDELEKQLSTFDQNLERQFLDALEKNIAKMRSDFNEALAGIKNESPDDFFESLFNSSEAIIQLSSLARAPKVSDNAFLMLIRAVSRLGRNNAALIQEFTAMCSFRKLGGGPEPRHFQN